MISAADFTIWKNEHPELPITLKFYKGPHKPERAWEEVVIQPGETKQLPSVYDQAIQTTDKAGKIIGGQAPVYLVRKGKAPPVAPAILAAANAGEAERDLAAGGMPHGQVSLEVLSAMKARLDELEAAAGMAPAEDAGEVARLKAEVARLKAAAKKPRGAKVEDELPAPDPS